MLNKRPHLSPLRPCGKILKQRLIKGRGNIKFNEIEFSVCGFPSESFAEFIERFFVVGARGVGVDYERFSRFGVFQLHGSFKWESRFGVV